MKAEEDADQPLADILQCQKRPEATECKEKEKEWKGDWVQPC